MSSYTHVPQPHTLERLEHRDKPVKTADVLRAKANVRFNAWLAGKITDGVGTIWCLCVRGGRTDWPAPCIEAGR
jgi:hypothetical protein